MIDHVRDDSYIGFFSKEEGALDRVSLRPSRKYILSITYLFVYFKGNLSDTVGASVLKPLPELGNPLDRVVIPVGVNEDIGI